MSALIDLVAGSYTKFSYDVVINDSELMKLNTTGHPSYSESVRTIDLKSNESTIILQCSDTFKLVHLKIPVSINLDDIESISISTVWEIPFALLRKLVKVIECNSYYYVPIHNKLLITSYYKVLEQYQDTNLMELVIHFVKQILLKSSIDFNYQLVVVDRFYQSEDRRKIAQNTHTCSMNDYSTNDLFNGEVKLSSSSCSTGFFIETERYPLQALELQLNGHSRFKYDAHDIATFGKLLHVGSNWSKKHSMTLHILLKDILPTDIINYIEQIIDPIKKYLYWISFEPSKAWSDSMFRSWLNLNRIDIAKITTEPKLNGKVYVLEKKKYVVNNLEVKKIELWNSN